MLRQCVLCVCLDDKTMCVSVDEGVMDNEVNGRSTC